MNSEPIQVVDVPDRIPSCYCCGRVNRRLTEYLAARAAGRSPRTEIRSNVIARPFTEAERAEREARLRARRSDGSEKAPRAFTYRRSAAEAYQPKPVQPPPSPMAKPAAPSPSTPKPEFRRKAALEPRWRASITRNAGLARIAAPRPVRWT